MLRCLVLMIAVSQVGCALLANRQMHGGQPPSRTPSHDLDTLEMLVGRDPLTIEDIVLEAPAPEELRLGMEKSSVQGKWGSPQRVEVAGGPESGFERWTYLKTVPTMDGYTQQTKVIYFEQGSVVGWENR